MAEQLPSLYTFGQVKVDTSSLAALQGKLLAQQQAKQEALDKYFEKQMASLSREGIYEKDVNGYEKRIADLSKKWKEGKQDIRKGGKAQVDFENEVQKIKEYVYQSKENKKNLVEAYKLQREGKLGTDDDISVISYMETAQDDPSGRKPDGTRYGWKDFSAYVPQFDDKARTSYFSNISSGIEPTQKKKVSSKSVPGGDVEEVYEISYSPTEVKFMVDKALQSLPTSKIASTYYQQLKSNPTDARFVKLKEAWDKSKLYPGDEMDTVEDLAKADIIREFLFRPPQKETVSRNIPQRSGGQRTSGPGDTWESYYIISKKPTVPIPGTNKRGVKATDVSTAEREIIKSLGLTPAIINGEDWYISGGPNRWEDDLGNFVTDEDIANKTAPAELKRARKGGTTKPKVTY